MKISLRLSLLLALIISVFQINAQFISGISEKDTSFTLEINEDDNAYKSSLNITKEDLRKHLTIIASDEFQGRETGQPGNDLAAQYIADELERMGIEPVVGDSYFQKVDFSWISWDDIGIYVGDNRYKHLWDFLSFPDKNNNIGDFEADEVIFLGYGIDDPNYSDYKKAKLDGKVIMINEGEPQTEDGKYVISGSSALSGWTEDKKLELASQKGVKAVLIITSDIQAMLAENRKKLLGPSVIMGEKKDLPLVANSAFISTNIAKDLIGKKEKKIIKARKKIRTKGKSKKVKLKSNLKLTQKVSEFSLAGNNILAYVEGSDKKDELVIVSAHYDHVGMRGEDNIYNGADDNGSGTSTVLELAEAFSTAKEEGNGPRRSILFLWLTGEEKGLLGSEYYTSHPVFPLERTICDINIDMVGRVDAKYEDNPNYIYVIGSDRISMDLHDVNEQMNKKYSNLTLDYTYNSEKDPNRFYYRSDHYNFAKNGIPSIFFFNGVHEDYHKVTDTIDKINFEKMENVARHIFHLTWKVSNQESGLRITNGRA